jgi:hypothetical protein
MHRYWSRILVAFAAMFILHASPAAAQATRTWVSGVGDDVNPCSRTAPCKTFAGAISKTAAGGEINCLDSGGFGAVTITKSMTINCEGVIGGALAGGNGIVINAGVDDRITLNGLDIFGVNPPLNGIRVVSAREVIVSNSYIRNFPVGISVAATTQVSVTVINTQIINNPVGIDVASAGGNGAVRLWNSYVIGSTTVGLRLSVAGNKAEISGNVINRTPKSIQVGAGTSVLSDGTNIVSPGDAPTGVLPKV